MNSVFSVEPAPVQYGVHDDRVCYAVDGGELCVFLADDDATLVRRVTMIAEAHRTHRGKAWQI